MEEKASEFSTDMALPSKRGDDSKPSSDLNRVLCIWIHVNSLWYRDLPDQSGIKLKMHIGAVEKIELLHVGRSVVNDREEKTVSSRYARMTTLRSSRNT